MGKPIKHGKGWQIRWCDENGIRRGQTFLNYSDAQKAERRYQIEVEAIKAGIRVRPLKAHTFQELADYWMEHRATKKRNPGDDRSILNAHLLPFFGTTKVNEITLHRVNEFERNMDGKVSPKTLHNHLTLLNSMLNMALDIRWLTEKPKIKKPKLIEKPYKFLQTSGEIRLLLEAARHEAPGTFELFSTAVFTGMRAGELAGLHWADVNLNTRQILVHRSYNGPTKSGRTRVVPILDSLLPVLREWRLKNPLPVLFPNAVGKMYRESDRVFQEIFQRCLKRVGLNRIRFHDLRHTFASHWMMNNGSLYRLKDILGHSTIKMTEQYAHLTPKLFAEDYGRLAIPLSFDNEPLLLKLGRNNI